MCAARKSKKARKRIRRKRLKQAGEPSALDLIEEGVNLLRRTSLLAWGVYLCGVAPFVVGFLFFWTEMASSGLAEQVLVPSCLGLGILFIWLKLTQVYFSKGLRDALYGGPGVPWTLSVWLRVLRQQAFWQATGIVLLPLASIVTVPFAWVFAFYQNLLTADPTETDESAEGFARGNLRLARIWHEQNWMLLTLFALVALLCWLNWMSVLAFGPYLLKSLLGIETVFSRVGLHLFNSTALFSCLLLSYVVTDPLVKAAYLLRRHYSESRRSGADLDLRFRRSVMSAGQKLSVLLLLGGSLFCAISPQPVSASESAAVEVNVATVEAGELEQSIDTVLSRREFVWRFPREARASSTSDGWLKSFFDHVELWQERFERWLEDLFGKKNKKNKDGSDFNFGAFEGMGSLLSYILIAGFVLFVLILIFRAWRMYEPLDSLEGVAENDVDVVPDLEDENVAADLLPRNRWLELARELITKGELRLALRAYFLAQLSALSSEGLILIQRSKSNREYAREISRRGHGREGLLNIYRQQVRLFESVWYGDCQAGPEQLAEMERYLAEQGVLS